MPVYNAEKFLRPAIDSILSQTLPDFELIIINDGSTDQSESIFLSYRDSRIRLINNTENLGIVESLNKGIDSARGLFVARMDADDISSIDRFEKQYSFMQSYPETVACGSQAYCINSEGAVVANINVAEDHDLLFVNLLFNNSFVHSSAFFRTEILRKYKYSKEYQYAEDYHLFVRIAREHRVANLSDYLVFYRNHNENTTNTMNDKMMYSKFKVQKLLLDTFLGNKNDEKTADVLYSFSNYNFQEYSAQEYRRVLEHIKKINKKSRFFDEKTLNSALYEKWHNFLATKKGLNFFCIFLTSSLFSLEQTSGKQLWHLFRQQVLKKDD